MGLVIDTSALVEIERLRSGDLRFDLPLNEAVIIPAVVWAEALVGVRLADSATRAARRRSRLEALRLVCSIEPFTAEIAEDYADIFAELMKRGSMIPQNDIAVAATARAAGFAVLCGSRDEKHFRAVKQLKVVVLRSAKR